MRRKGTTIADDFATIYEMRVQRALKGAPAADELLRVHALGGMIGERGLLVPGEAHYRQGQQVLLFLTRDEQGRWRTTDLTLGRRARSATSSDSPS